MSQCSEHFDDTHRSLLLGSAVAAASIAVPPVAALAALPNRERSAWSIHTITTTDGTQICYKDWGSARSHHAGSNARWRSRGWA